MNVLYLSYDGMTDPLGQSQVLPYLRELTRLGHSFTLISFEKPDRYSAHGNYIANLMKEAGIAWQPMLYTKRPPIVSTLYDAYRMKQLAFKLHREQAYEAVHCRSYIAALVGQQLKKAFGVKFIFDMRGFWADERVDGGLWKLKNPAYNLVYKFFKRKEREFLAEADYTITLTEAAKNEIERWNFKPASPVAVIPCCADLKLFSDRDKPVKPGETRKELGIGEDDFVLSYLGSIGTWYMPSEMMDFFKQLLQRIPSARFLFITGEPREKLVQLAATRGIEADRIITVTATHKQVPAYLAISNWSLFFIKPVYSKIASSPTKQGEIMGMGIPHVCNAGVGDVATILKDGNSGIVIEQFNTAAYNRAIDDIMGKTFDKNAIIAKADEIYSLEKGVAKYAAVYKKLANR